MPKQEGIKCSFCKGSGAVDSGGTDPSGNGIDVMCGNCLGTGREDWIEALEEDLLRTLSIAYPTDDFGAGISLAWVNDRQMWYASVCRYPSADTRERKIVCNAASKIDLLHAKLMVMLTWCRKKATDDRINKIKRQLHTRWVGPLTYAKERAEE